MPIADLSAMLGVPVDTFYGWRYRVKALGLPRRPPRSLPPLKCGAGGTG
jgi:hypothetical protein